MKENFDLNNQTNDERDDVSEIAGYCPSELNDEVGLITESPNSERSWIDEENSQPTNKTRFSFMKQNKSSTHKKHEYSEEEVITFLFIFIIFINLYYRKLH